MNYKDQNVVGTAGPYRQFFAEVSREMVAEDCGAFESVDRFVESGKTVFFVRAGRSSAGFYLPSVFSIKSTVLAFECVFNRFVLKI